MTSKTSNMAAYNERTREMKLWEHLAFDRFLIAELAKRLSPELWQECLDEQKKYAIVVIAPAEKGAELVRA